MREETKLPFASRRGLMGTLAGAASCSALRSQCASRGNHHLEGTDVMARGSRAQYLQAMVRHHKGKNRGRARIQAICRQGSRWRFRAD